MSSTLSIDERFEAFHRRNPEILEQLIQLAKRAKAKGFRTYSVKALWEIIRFNASTPDTQERYKLSNNYTSRYARLVMTSEPELQGFFNTREINTVDRDDDLLNLV